MAHDRLHVGSHGAVWLADDKCRVVADFPESADGRSYRRCLATARRLAACWNQHDALISALRGTVEALQQIRDGNRGQGLITQHGDALDAALTALTEADGDHA